MATVNPCGLSYDRTVQIIKEKVLTGNYNGRQEIMTGLLKEGFSYAEASEVTDAYFQIYRRVASAEKNTKLGIALTSEQKTRKRINNVMVDYLNGEIQGFPMSKDDVEALEKIYEKEAAAETPTLKGKYNEEAAVFIQKFLPGYTNEIFKTSVYARPLLSAVFFIKSMTSNLHAQIERSITDSLWDGKQMDFTSLYKSFSGLANQSFLNVVKGGVPVTNLYQSELTTGTDKGRLEEFSLKGTAANGKLSKYWELMNFMSRWSNRLNSAPDTRGIFSNAERHMYQLLKEKYRDERLSKDKAVQQALKDMELDDLDTATRMATDKFKELELPTKGAEFNVAVEEYRRMKRDETIWAKALLSAKNDFWKRNMTVASQLGFGDYGLFGLKAQALSGLRDKAEKTFPKSKSLSAFNLYAFGFLNGAANFAEDALERVPMYAAVKIAFLQARKGAVNDVELQKDIVRRQRDIVVKNVLTAAFFFAARLLEKEFCKDYEGKQGTKEISEGRVQLGVCGIPVLIPPQMMAAYKMYSLIDEATDNDEDFFNAAAHVIPILVQSNQIGLQSGIDKIGTSMTNAGIASSRGNAVKSAEEWDKARKTAFGMGASVANSFLPLPSRVISEAGTFLQRLTGIAQKQQALPFAIDESGNKKGLFESMGKVTVASLGNVTGVSEIMIAAQGADKPYGVDWQGRKIVQFRGSDITGSGIQYTAADDILATAGVRTPYVNRLEKVQVNSSKEKITGFEGQQNITGTTKGVRYMTDEEFFNVSVALGKFNKEYFEKNGQNIINLVKSDKDAAKKEFESLFKAAKASAVDAITVGKKTDESILQKIREDMEARGKKKRKTSSTELAENE